MTMKSRFHCELERRRDGEESVKRSWRRKRSGCDEEEWWRRRRRVGPVPPPVSPAAQPGAPVGGQDGPPQTPRSSVLDQNSVCSVRAPRHNQ